MPADPEDIFISRREFEVYLDGHDLRHQEALAWRQRLAASLDGYLGRAEFERILGSWTDEREQGRATRKERQEAHEAVHAAHAAMHERQFGANRLAHAAAQEAHTKLHEAHSLAHDEQHQARLLYDATIDAGNRTAIERAETTLREQTSLQAVAHAREHELQQRSTEALTALNQRAVEEVKETNKDRFDALNHAAARSRDERAAYATRDALDDRLSAVMARLGVLDQAVAQMSALVATATSNATRLNSLETDRAGMAGRDRGVQLAWSVAGAAIFLVIAIAGFMATRGGA